VRTIYKWLIALAIMALLVAALIYSCAPSKKELMRVSSPGGVVDAVLVVKLTGTLSPTPFFVYIVPSGSKKMGYPVLLGWGFCGTQAARWSAPRFLEIEFTKGKIIKFWNFWEDKSVQNFEYVVEVRLVPTSERSLP
jgi:hypothetical protein